MKRVIIAIVGESGSGKTEMSRYLQEMFGVESVVSYTTRPMREGETEGVEHYFVKSSEGFDKEQMLAYTVFGGHEYWTMRSQIKFGKAYSYVIDEKGLKYLKSKFKDRYTVVPVYVRRKDRDSIDEERKLRDGDRDILPERSYLEIIDNDSTLEEFHNKIDKFIEHGNRRIKGK